MDFLVIGAQRAGTTTLHHLLSSCPDIALPSHKEDQIFSDERLFAESWATKLGTVHERSEVASGSITPQYLVDPLAAERIRLLLPDVRLIVLIRERIDRSKSHHRMVAARGHEARSFEAAAWDLLEPTAAAVARTLRPSREAEISTYLAWSEYGRLLARYLDHFDASNLILIPSVNVFQHPLKAVNQIRAHIGLDAVEQINQPRPDRRNSSVEGPAVWIERVLHEKRSGVLYNKLPRALRRKLGQRARQRAHVYGNSVRRRASATRPEVQVSRDLTLRLTEHYESDRELCRAFPPHIARVLAGTERPPKDPQPS